jgi:hypothetical protein
MSHEALIPNLMAVIERLNAEGDCWGWPAEQMARIAIRRWNSYPRRHTRTKRVTAEARVLDLAKGLQAHFEPVLPYTPPSDWRALAEALTEVLQVRAR